MKMWQMPAKLEIVCGNKAYTSGSQTFMSLGPLLTAYIMTLGLCNIRINLPSEGLCTWPPDNCSMAPKVAEGPF